VGFIEGILKVQKWFVVNVLDFQIEPWCGYFAIFGLLTVLATFWVIFSPIFWSP
jgi:hypothetical protein